ncbi:hypothetical protein [Pseudozobellia thermophila]|uniref:DUF3311 domain-containing protein n=1 Tax=Pseudozobellia thermophila TaxID=192903 RepID=A0A1M6NXU8_9FLAO|nr:hypothetical protein [Pseudozobellia thermophila]SHK00506.1 hypothetical protein SAMN04488513_11621 [Pseudozobellia thermophila]
MRKHNRHLLTLLDSLALLVFIATFTSVVLPENTMDPFLMGIPYTMWVGFLVSVAFVVLAYLVSLVNKEDRHAD